MVLWWHSGFDWYNVWSEACDLADVMDRPQFQRLLKTTGRLTVDHRALIGQLWDWAVSDGDMAKGSPSPGRGQDGLSDAQSADTMTLEQFQKLMDHINGKGTSRKRRAGG